MRSGLCVFLACLLSVSGVLAEAPLCQTYTIKDGDSVWGIANALGILQSDLTTALTQYIGYVEGQTVLMVGQQIYLPPYYPDCQFVTNSGGEAKCKVYTVQAGDTLSGVATKFNIYLNNLQEINSDVIDSSVPMRVGLKLRLPPWSSSCPDPTETVPSCRYYVVQAGDYMAYIAAGFGVDINELLAANNGLALTSTLSPGQRVKIPPFPSSCGSGTAAKFPTEGITMCRSYIILTGDSLASIAVKFGTTVQDLIILNPEFTDANLLQPGRQIKIPKWDSSCTTPIIVTGTPAPPSPPSPPPSPPSPPRPPAPPSPKPAPSPSPVPSTSPVAAAPAPAPSSGLIIPSTSVTVNLTCGGPKASVDEFSTGLATIWIGAMADLVSLPTEFVTIESVSAVLPISTRRLQASTADRLVISTRFASSDPKSTTSELQAAQSNGELGETLNSMNLTLMASSLNAASSPSPASPSKTEAAAAGSSVSNVGAIVGGVAGGVAGLAVVAAVAMVVIRRRRNAQQAPGAAYAGASATLSRTVPQGKQDITSGHSNSPRALTPRRSMA